MSRKGLIRRKTKQPTNQPTQLRFSAQWLGISVLNDMQPHVKNDLRKLLLSLDNHVYIFKLNGTKQTPHLLRRRQKTNQFLNQK